MGLWARGHAACSTRIASGYACRVRVGVRSAYALLMVKATARQHGQDGEREQRGLGGQQRLHEQRVEREERDAHDC